jgi:type IV pilus assembly protein PilW
MKMRGFQKGMTLIELMVSMVLGLVVVGGVVSVLLSNKKSYSTNEGLSQIQETARTAFELMARDIRQAGGSGCDNALRMANVLTTGTSWWQNWSSIQGYDGGTADPAVSSSASTGERVSATDSIELMGIDGNMLPVLSHDAAGGSLRINAAATPFAVGDIMLVCDFDHTTTFQATAYDATNVAISHTSSGGPPGNCSQGLGFPTDCSSGTGNVHLFPQNSQIGRLYAVDWYVGNNGRTGDVGTSLFRRRLGPNATVIVEEIVSGVTDMQIQYGVNGSDTISSAGSLVGAAAWAPVNSVFITLTVRSSDANVAANAANAGRLERTFTYLITLRNRVT